MGTRHVVPAQFVPEDLIAQAQVVLQGKSRNLIIRELQRTNLDVNLAVNNLLSRDDEESEDMDDSQDSYMPSDDLMSLLDAGIHNDHPSVIIDADAVFPEDVFNYSSVRVRGSTNRGIASRTSGASGDRERDASAPDREHMIRFGSSDRSQYVSGSSSSAAPSSSRRWLEYALRDSASASDGRKSPGACSAGGVDAAGGSRIKARSDSQLNPIFINEQLEYWPAGDKKFTHIVALYSELAAIDSKGQLCQWKWADAEPYKCQISVELTIYHPKAVHLGLVNEKISHIAGTCVRASVVTESIKVATWIDESIYPVAHRLEHAAQSYGDACLTDRVHSLYVCSLYTCTRLESGALYWWGLAPFSHRKKLWEKLRTKAKKQKPSSAQSAEIVTGVQVCLRNSPSYHPGAIGFTTAGGMPKVGQLMTSAWSVTDSCTFKVLSPQEVKKLGVNLPQPPQPMAGPSKPQEHPPLGSYLQQPPSPSLSKRDSSQERLEMPPPPSPASSTCSEPGASPLPKRSKRSNNPSAVKDDDKKDEETWPLRDVVFLEDVKNLPIGRVIKIDGAYAAVRFHNAKDTATDNTSADASHILQDCRLLRKDELQLVKGSSWSRAPDCYQKVPKRVPITDTSIILTMTVSNQGIHAIVRNKNKLSYITYSVTTGKVEQDCAFATDVNSFMGQDASLIQLYCCGENETITLLRDGNGALYPMAKDCTDAIRDPITLDMAPAQAVGLGINPIREPSENQKNQVAVIVLALEHQILTPAILRSDSDFLRLTLQSLEKDAVSQQVLVSERIDRNRNILHTAVTTCFPTSNKLTQDVPPEDVDTDVLLNPQRSLNEMVRRPPPKSSARSAMQTVGDIVRDPNADNSDSDMMESSLQASASNPWSASDIATHTATVEAPFFDANEQKQQALNVLWVLTESAVLKPYLKELMCAKDALGHTPFMMAVSGRAYSAALHLFHVAQKIARETSSDPDTQKKVLQQMIYPRGSNPDDSPLHVLCCNDTCSFTWTGEYKLGVESLIYCHLFRSGAEHINQYIYECKTCGLTGSLCCCTECARVCHKGHDCKLKKTSPTAYCDCWEKCKCKALIMGSQSARSALLKKILADTDLVTLPNGKGENVLLFLVQTVGRQQHEQKSYRPHTSRPRSSMARKTPEVANGIDAEMPDHDLEPPRFARKALDRILGDWNAVKALILTGFRGDNTNISSLANSNRSNLSFAAAEEHAFLMSQNGTALLDKFTHALLKVGHEMLETLLTTIVRECSSPYNCKEAKLVARRFVRSVARIGVVLCIELNPSAYSNITYSSSSSGSSSQYKKSASPQLTKCRRVFQALLPVAIEELCEIADSLIAPVRLGVARPTAPFSLVSVISDAVNYSEELFSADPILAVGFNAAEAPVSAAEQIPEMSMRVSDIPPPLMMAEPAAVVEAVHGDEESDVAPEAVEEQEDIAELEDPVMLSHEVAPEESDSDSDSNPDDASYLSNVDNASAVRSTTAATAGSDAGVASLAYFSEDDSDGSSNGDEEDESEAAETEPDTEELSFMEEPIERRNTSGGASSAIQQISASSSSNPTTTSQVRSNLAQHLQWALRHRDLTSSTSNSGVPSSSTARIPASAITSSTGLIHIDPGTVRRSGNPVAVPTGSSSSSESVSMSTTAVSLARAFSIVIRQISALLPILQNSTERALTGGVSLSVSASEAQQLLQHLENKLQPVWEWMINVMDSTEGQLRFGCSLTNSSGTATTASFSGQPANGGRPARRSAEDLRNIGLDSRTSGATRRTTTTGRSGSGQTQDTINNAARRDFLSYMMSLMRTHNSEHFDSLPVLDVASLKHIAYVFDAFIFYVRAGIDESAPVAEPLATRVDEWPPDSENEADDADDDVPPFIHSEVVPMDDDSGNMNSSNSASALATKGRNHTFFKRSDSTLFLGCPPPDPFAAAAPEALPLAEQPHILQPASRREELFGVPRVISTNHPDAEFDSLPSRLSLSSRYDDRQKKDDAVTVADVASTSSHTPAALSRLPVITDASQTRSPIIVSAPSLATASNKSSVIVHAGSIKNSASHANTKTSDENSDKNISEPVLLAAAASSIKKPAALIGNRVQHDILLGRWRLALELFGRVFVDDVGLEPSSVINELGGFPVKVSTCLNIVAISGCNRPCVT